MFENVASLYYLGNLDKGKQGTEKWENIFAIHRVYKRSEREKYMFEENFAWQYNVRNSQSESSSKL